MTDPMQSDTKGKEVEYASYISRPSAPAESSSAGQGAARKTDSSTKSALPSSTRLYIGNLSSAVDEYLLVNTFNKYGKISKVDYLFHKTGPMKGKPRGYAFIEYQKAEEAMHALTATNNRTLRGRPISVSFANANEHSDQSGGIGPRRNHRDQSDASKPTTLSLLKNAAKPRGGINAKIAAMEAKLADLQRESPGASTQASAQTSSQLKGHPSLPPKPTFKALPER